MQESPRQRVRGTVRNALTELVESGILALKPNIGYFVPETLPVSFRKERHMVFILPEETQKPGNHYLEGLEKTASANGIDLKVVILRDGPDRLDAVDDLCVTPAFMRLRIDVTAPVAIRQVKVVDDSGGTVFDSDVLSGGGKSFHKELRVETVRVYTVMAVTSDGDVKSVTYPEKAAEEGMRPE